MAEQKSVGRHGRVLNPVIKERVMQAMTNPMMEGHTQADVAAEVGIHPRTLHNYLTPEVCEEIRQRRLLVMSDAMGAVDRAVLAKALKGDMTAAKLIYTRWEQEKALEKDAFVPRSVE
ncbi:MAG: hypothetical protein WAX89_06720, partial [Alphaproteobacteria bacterium]